MIKKKVRNSGKRREKGAKKETKKGTIKITKNEKGTTKRDQKTI